MRTSRRMWAGTSTGRRRTRGGWAILRWRRSRPGPAGWYRLREAQVSSTPHRLNRERFSQTAELFAANRAIERLSHLDALLHLVAPEPEDLLLDVACGPGRLLATFAPHVRMAVGLDLTLEMLRIARKLSVEGAHSLGLVLGEGERLPFPDGTFTLVTTTLAIHHYGEPRRVIEEMVRVCRPGGRIAVGDTVGSPDEAKRARQNEIERLRDPSHVEALSPGGLEALLTSCGLTVEGMASGTVVREFEEWCRVAGAPADVAARVRVALLDTRAG
ncbi:MAG: class I SAM-dependent methyltransferase, partial [Bacillati bacterium ANGP1]